MRGSDIVTVTLRDWQRSREMLTALTNERNRLASHARRLQYQDRQLAEAARAVVNLLERQVVCLDCCAHPVADDWHHAGCAIGTLADLLREREL